MSFFEKGQKNDSAVKILMGVVVLLILLDIAAFRMVSNIAENKTISINVPSYMDTGDYVIGARSSTNNVYEMWGRVWFEQLSNFSYKDVRGKIDFIKPFLDRKTMFESKAELEELVMSVERNFISQRFDIKSYEVKRLNGAGNFVEIIAHGSLFRTVGLRSDELNGIPYAYSIVAYTRHGQVIIKNLKSFVDKTGSQDTKKLLKNNTYINFDNFLDGEDVKNEELKKKELEKISKGVL